MIDAIWRFRLYLHINRWKYFDVFWAFINHDIVVIKNMLLSFNDGKLSWSIKPARVRLLSRWQLESPSLFKLKDRLLIQHSFLNNSQTECRVLVRLIHSMAQNLLSICLLVVLITGQTFVHEICLTITSLKIWCNLRHGILCEFRQQMHAPSLV